MNNQQPSSEKEKVQRLSRKRVLNNEVLKNIVWETQPIKNAVYIYTLSSSKDHIPRYVGSTITPLVRLKNHMKSKENGYKANWVNSIFNNNHELIMTVIDYSLTVKEALIKEEHYIKSIPNLTNYELFPTKPRYKECYLYNIITGVSKKYESLQLAASDINLKGSVLTNIVLKHLYLFNYIDDFENIIEKHHTILIKREEVIKKFITQRQVSIYLNCSMGLVNFCLMGQRKSCKGWKIIKKGGDFNKIEKNLRYKSVKCLNDNKIFDTGKIASQYYNIDNSSLLKCCKGLRKSVGGYKFVYFNDDIVQP